MQPWLFSQIGIISSGKSETGVCTSEIWSLQVDFCPVKSTWKPIRAISDNVRVEWMVATRDTKYSFRRTLLKALNLNDSYICTPPRISWQWARWVRGVVWGRTPAGAASIGLSFLPAYIPHTASSSPARRSSRRGDEEASEPDTRGKEAATSFSDQESDFLHPIPFNSAKYSRREVY